VRDVCAAFTPESVEAFCRVPADTIRRLAREFAAAPTGALYGRIGLCNQEFGTLASWLVDVVNIIVGKFDRPGGLMGQARQLADGLDELHRARRPAALRPLEVTGVGRARGARPGTGRPARRGDRDTR
jgi:anaerobic selenocysteine-containing dehydrogenase